MAWWIWIVAGAALLTAEVVIATDFYLVFLGISALVLGLLGLFHLELSDWFQILLFAVLAVALTVSYQRGWKRKFTTPDREMGPELVGETGTAEDLIPPGGRGRVDLRGATWNARNDGDEEIPSGAHCIVLRVDGLTLHIRADH